ncbi:MULTISPECIES: dihydrofolate reductase family protein [unclassified Salinibacterium]|uniref:dihydrofolate reductase family protein n=1 Tax=unclassified Salinibacterium TaxID=2632331 RepID=UPI001423A5C4|nr:MULTISPECIES: dihydrofolate reductase family protein [unclassified Salinibacterium]
MSSIVVQTFITLDGVMQAPGGSDEDVDDGFAHGGWQFRYGEGSGVDEVVTEWEQSTAALLLGRRTYDIFARSWGVWDENAPGLEGEFTRIYNRIPKFVASRTLTDPRWRNTHVLVPDVPAAVDELRRRDLAGEIRVWGSSVLIRTLAAHNLIDEYRLVRYPIVLGSGKRLFGDGFPFTRFEMVARRPLGAGVNVEILRPVR